MSIKKQSNGTYNVRVTFSDNLGKRREKNKKYQFPNFGQEMGT